MKRVLVATYGAAHVAIALPLYRGLVEAGIEPVMLGLTTAAETLRGHGIPVRRFLDYVDLKDPVIQHWGEFLCRAHHRDGIGISKDESLAYLGASMAELVSDVGEDTALERYREAGLNALLPVRTLRRVMEVEKVHGVIATDSPRAERAALVAASQTGLPSVCVVSNFPHIGLHYLQLADNGAVMCVLNERIRDQLIATGRAASSVVVTGNPAFDALIAPDNAVRRDALRAGAGLSSTDWSVLWAEQPEPGNPELAKSMREHLARWCATHGWRLIVRLHPSSQAGEVVKLPDGVLLSPRSESVREALLKSDAVVTFTSTIGFEALVLDKPVVVAAVSQFSRFADYRKEDGVLVVDSIDAVEQGLLSFHRNDEQARELAHHRRAMPRSGQSTRLIIDCLARQWAPAPASTESL